MITFCTLFFINAFRCCMLVVAKLCLRFCLVLVGLSLFELVAAPLSVCVPITAPSALPHVHLCVHVHVEHTFHNVRFESSFVCQCLYLQLSATTTTMTPPTTVLRAFCSFQHANSVRSNLIIVCMVHWWWWVAVCTLSIRTYTPSLLLAFCMHRIRESSSHVSSGVIFCFLLVLTTAYIHSHVGTHRHTCGMHACLPWHRWAWHICTHPHTHTHIVLYYKVLSHRRLFNLNCLQTKLYALIKCFTLCDKEFRHTHAHIRAHI